MDGTLGRVDFELDTGMRRVDNELWVREGWSPVGVDEGGVVTQTAKLKTKKKERDESAADSWIPMMIFTHS